MLLFLRLCRVVAFYGICRKNEEPTSGLKPLSCSLRVIIHVLQGFAEGCKSPISRPVSFLCPALHRIALPVVSEWCQLSLSHPHNLTSTSSPFQFISNSFLMG